MTIEQVNPNDPEYREINQSFGRGRHTRMNYKSVAKRYNDSDINSILLVEFTNSAQLHNIAKTLVRWGLRRNDDYSIRRMTEDSYGNPLDDGYQIIAIKKLSTTLMQRN
jgi:hypothetical protein